MLKGHVFQSQTFQNEAFAHFINTFLNGISGITKGCELSNTQNSVSIGAGYFCIYGRFLQIIGNEIISDISNSGYYSLVCEIDLDKVNTDEQLNQADIKLVRSTTEYPTMTQEDLDANGKVYQYEFARFRVIDGNITDFTDRRTFLRVSSIYSQLLAHFDAVMDEKSADADALLQQIQNELASIEDESIFLLKSQIQKGTEIPSTLPDDTIYIQVFDDE